MKENPARVSSEELQALPRPHVLVAEDEDTIRMVVTDVLQDAGYEVTGAANGREALDAYQEGSFGVVVTDIMMPQMSGLDLLGAIKAADDECEVIVMTSHGTMDSALRALRSGAYDFITKPFESLDLITSTVQRAADKVRLKRHTRKLTEDLVARTRELDDANNALRRLADTLKDQADHDGLTGLQNHRAFREALNREIATSERAGGVCSLIFMDVDHFKLFNDTNGHLAGDAVLKQLAELVPTVVPEDAFLARYGGEEIVALIPGMPKEDAVRIADRVRKTVEEHSFVGPESQALGQVTLSLGVASYPEDGAEATQIIEHADRAVYEAKDRGRNTVAA